MKSRVANPQQLAAYQLLLNDLSLLNKNNRKRFDRLIQDYYSKEEFLQFMIDRILTSNHPQDKEIFLFLEKRDVEVFDALMICLKQRYNDPVFDELLTDANNNQLKRRLAVVTIPDNLKSILNNAFKQFALPLYCYSEKNPAELKNLPTVIWMKTLNEMLHQKNNEDKHPYMLVNRQFYLLSKQVNPDTQNLLYKKYQFLSLHVAQYDHDITDKKNKIAQIDMDLLSTEWKRQDIGELLTLIEDELRQVTCSQRPWPWKLMIFESCVAILTPICIYFSITGFRNADRCEREMTNTPVSLPGLNSTCADLSRIRTDIYTDYKTRQIKYEYGTFKMDLCDSHGMMQNNKLVEIVPICYKLCNEYKPYNDQRIASTFFAVALGIFGACTFPVLYRFISSAFDSKTARDFRDNNLLSTFSPRLQQTAREVLNTEDKKLDKKSTIQSTRARINELLADLKNLDTVKQEAKTKLQSEQAVLERERKYVVTRREMYARHLPKDLITVTEVKATMFESKSDSRDESVKRLAFQHEFKRANNQFALEMNDGGDVLKTQNVTDLDEPLMGNPAPRKSRCPKFCVVM
jgi:hypothetical protein